jgi:26S proteasome non-ATPase regulatory subunit 10
MLVSESLDSNHVTAELNRFYFLGNTPLHLAMESAYAAAAVLLIEAGADRGRVSPHDQLYTI